MSTAFGIHRIRNVFHMFHLVFQFFSDVVPMIFPFKWPFIVDFPIKNGDFPKGSTSHNVPCHCALSLCCVRHHGSSDLRGFPVPRPMFYSIVHPTY